MISAQIATPRGQRKPLRAVIERVEGFLDGLSEEFVAQLRRCEASQLVSLSQAMGMLEELSVQESECEHVMALVTAALDDLACCSDPVTRATALLSSIKQSDRHRGLALLSSLDRRMLEKPEEAEVSAVAMVVSHLLGESVAVEERTAAWMAVSVLTLRNTIATIHSHAEAVSRWGLEVLNPILEGCVQGPGIFRLLASSCAVFGSLAGQAWAKNNAAVQAATDKAFAESLGVKDSPAQQEARASLLYGKFPELLPAVVQGLGDADLDLAAGIAGCLEPILHLAGRYGRTPARWDELRPLVDALNVPVVANGDVVCFDDFEKVRAETGCHSVMAARGALWNCSIFRSEGFADLHTEVIPRYTALAARWSCSGINSTRVVNEMRAAGRRGRVRRTQQ